MSDGKLSRDQQIVERFTRSFVEMGFSQEVLDAVDMARCQMLCKRRDNRNMPPGVFQDIYETILEHSNVLKARKGGEDD